MLRYFFKISVICLLAIVSTFNAYSASRTQIYDRWYRVDTLQCSEVGPGTKYAAIKFTAEDKSLTFRTFFLTVDVDNPRLKFQVELANDSIIGGEAVRAHAQKRTVPGKYYIGGTNGDFYTTTVPVGIPINGCTQNGMIATPPPAGTPHFVITDERTPWCSTLTQNTSMKVNGGASIGINRVNGNRYTNELVLYNSLTGKYTHTASGGKEIAVQLLDGEIWKINAPVKAKVVGVASAAGNMPILPGQGVLSADGSAIAVIEALKEGDNIEFNLNQTMPTFGGITPNITQTVGSNTFLVQNGQVVQQGDMARHPRTMMGYTKDQKQLILCVVDGRSAISSGGIYYDLADIMIYAGADWAVNVDGGGSSTMYVQNLGIMNVPSDGTERSVSNGMYLVLDAPEDNAIASIKFKDWAMKFPKYGTYKPTFYGYNQYGMLIDSDVKGVELSCDSKLGHIQDGSTFVGDGDGTYPLTATYKGLTTTIPVTVEVSDKVAFRLKEVINDAYREYPVEVQVEMNEKYMPITPAALKWNSDDASIVSIGETTGILKGIVDGETYVRGTVGEFKGDLKVTVEKPKSHSQAIDPNLDASTWAFSSAGTTKIAAEPFDNGMKLNFNGASGRSPYIKMAKRLRLWSLPDSVRLRINPGDMVIKKVTISLSPNEGSASNIDVAVDLPKNTMSVITLATKDWCDVKDLLNYPIYLNYINFATGASSVGKPYTIEIPGIETIYDAISSGVEGVIADESSLAIFPNPVNKGDFVKIQLPQSGKADVKIYDELGRILYATAVNVENGAGMFSSSYLEKGTFIMTVTINGKGYNSKLIVK